MGKQKDDAAGIDTWSTFALQADAAPSTKRKAMPPVGQVGPLEDPYFAVFTGEAVYGP